MAARHNRGHGPGAIDKAKDFKGTLKKLLKLISKYKVLIILSFIFAIGSTIFSIVSPKILGNATTEIYTGIVAKINGTGGINFNAIGKILILLIILYIVSALFNYIQSLIMTRVSQQTSYSLRKNIAHKLNKLPMSYFDSENTGDILSIITNDVDTLQASLNQSATQLVSSLVTIIGIFVMMCTINVTLAIITALVLPFASIIVMSIVKKSQKHFVNQQKFLAEVDSEVEEMVSGHDVIKAFNAEDKMIASFDEDNKKLFEAGFKSQFLSGLMHPIMNFVGNLNYALIAILGSIFAIKGKITVGNIQSFIQYSKNFTNPIAQLAQISSQIQSMIAASERVFTFLDNEEYLDNGVLSAENVKGNIEFKNVAFSYTDSQKVLNDISLKINRNESIALVGRTGSGKTSMVNLMCRFYDLQEGQIKINGNDYKEYSIKSLRNKIGYIMQKVVIFDGTILENINYTNKNISKEKIIEICKKLNLHEKIMSLKEGYETKISNDTDIFSAGEKQLINFSRIMVEDSEIIILDEATASLSYKSEMLVRKGIEEITKNKISLIIAHRLSTIKKCDNILLMKDGKIIEQGNHEKLMNEKGEYYQLVNI